MAKPIHQCTTPLGACLCVRACVQMCVYQCVCEREREKSLIHMLSARRMPNRYGQHIQ